MSSEKVILSVSGLKQGRKRRVDPEHAVSVLDLTRRGYTVNIRGERGVSSVGFTRKGNVIKGVVHDTNKVGAPEWMDLLLTLVNRYSPDDINVITTTGENP